MSQCVARMLKWKKCQNTEHAQTDERGTIRLCVCVCVCVNTPRSLIQRTAVNMSTCVYAYVHVYVNVCVCPCVLAPTSGEPTGVESEPASLLRGTTTTSLS